MKILGIIPARFASTRFPGKPLAVISGKTMIQRVYEQAARAGSLSDLFVATDDARIFDHVNSFGGKAMMTSATHPNGTSRCQEVISKLARTNPDEKYEAVINIQGDEPFIDPIQIDLVSALIRKPEATIGTLVKKIESLNELLDENNVKVVFNRQMNALYFSRQPIPFLRGIPGSEWLSLHSFYKHVGIYGYRTTVLNEIVKLKEGKLEAAEKLEQLRWLENSYAVTVELTDIESLAVDTPDDLLKLSNKG